MGFILQIKTNLSGVIARLYRDQKMYNNGGGCNLPPHEFVQIHNALSENEEALSSIAYCTDENPSQLRAPVNETRIVMKTRHTLRCPDYERPYCGACNHYVPDDDAAFCCWCGAKFVTACVSMSADEAEVEK